MTRVLSTTSVEPLRDYGRECLGRTPVDDLCYDGVTRVRLGKRGGALRTPDLNPFLAPGTFDPCPRRHRSEILSRYVDQEVRPNDRSLFFNLLCKYNGSILLQRLVLYDEGTIVSIVTRRL